MNVPEGGVWEFAAWKLEKDWSPGPAMRQYYKQCRHVKDFVWPFVVIAKNEAGFNSTGVCALCVVEAME